MGDGLWQNDLKKVYLLLCCPEHKPLHIAPGHHAGRPFSEGETAAPKVRVNPITATAIPGDRHRSENNVIQDHEQHHHGRAGAPTTY